MKMTVENSLPSTQKRWDTNHLKVSDERINHEANFELARRYEQELKRNEIPLELNEVLREFITTMKNSRNERIL